MKHSKVRIDEVSFHLAEIWINLNLVKVRLGKVGLDQEVPGQNIFYGMKEARFGKVLEG